MTFSAFLALLPALFGFAGLQAAEPRVRTMMVEEQVIMRVPVRPWRLPPRIEWIEKKGPKCIPADEIRGAMLSGRDQVDFLLIDRTRIRAELDGDCPLDFYQGFYLTPEKGRVCADRDSLRSQMGADCTIEKFRRLEPRVAK